MKSPFPMTRHQMREREKKKINWRTIVMNTCMKLNCSINLHPRFYTMSGQTDNVDQDQTVLPVNLVDIVCKTYNFKLAVFRF